MYRRQVSLFPIDPQQSLFQPPPFINPPNMQQLHWQGADTMSMPWNGFYVLQPSPFINPFNIQQLHWQPDTMSMPWNGFHIEPIPPGPIYQGMAQQHEAPSWGPHHNQQERPHQAEPQYTPQRHEHQYQSPSSGPSRNQRRRFRQAVPQYKSHTHESYGPVIEDRSTQAMPGSTPAKTQEMER